MTKYRITLTSTVSLVAQVEAETEDKALDMAHDMAQEFSDRYHPGDFHVFVNDDWDARDAEVEELT